ncbi:MAG: hypothetical protein MUF15_20305, partial [Acidobacteria bacterium]|nr:hypothetical protein [Acidobacteriota bacterium]
GRIVWEAGRTVWEVGRTVWEAGRIVWEVGRIVWEAGRTVWEVGRIVWEVGRIVWEMGRIVWEAGRIVFVPRNTPDWLKKAFAFYQNTINDPEAISELDFYGVTAEMLQANESKIYEVEAAYRIHKSKMGDAQDAIEKRDQSLKEITVFMKKFIGKKRDRQIMALFLAGL